MELKDEAYQILTLGRDPGKPRRKILGGFRRVRVKKRWVGLRVVSERLGLSGVIDQVVELEIGLAVVESKYGAALKKPPKHHVYQAVAYAMLAEEVIGKPIRSTILQYLPKGKAFKLPVTDHIKRHVEWTVKQIRKIVNEEKILEPRPERQCSGVDGTGYAERSKRYRQLLHFTAFSPIVSSLGYFWPSIYLWCSPDPNRVV